MLWIYYNPLKFWRKKKLVWNILILKSKELPYNINKRAKLSKVLASHFLVCPKVILIRRGKKKFTKQDIFDYIRNLNEKKKEEKEIFFFFEKVEKKKE